MERLSIRMRPEPQDSRGRCRPKVFQNRVLHEPERHDSRSAKTLYHEQDEGGDTVEVLVRRGQQTKRL